MGERIRVFTGWWLVAMVTLTTACGEDGDGNEDTLFTGLSGVVIFVLVLWLVLRAVKRRR
jgi:hypothetical protein